MTYLAALQDRCLCCLTVTWYFTHLHAYLISPHPLQFRLPLKLLVLLRILYHAMLSQSLLCSSGETDFFSPIIFMINMGNVAIGHFAYINDILAISYGWLLINKTCFFTMQLNTTFYIWKRTAKQTKFFPAHRQILLKCIFLMLGVWLLPEPMHSPTITQTIHTVTILHHNEYL